VRVPWLYCRLLYTIVSSIKPLKSADPYFEDIKKLDCETSRLSKVKIGRIKRPNAKRRIKNNYWEGFENQGPYSQHLVLF
jgi:hypothetical protein